MDSTSIRTLFGILIVFLVLSSGTVHSLQCIRSENCLCFEYENIEFQCPRSDPDGPEISVKVTPKNHVEIQCLKTPIFNVSLLPEIDAEEAVLFKMEYCYLNTTFSEILRRLKVRNLKYLTFETTAQENNTMIIDISKEMFESMNGLENMALDYSTINLHDNFLENTPNLLKLSLTRDGLYQIGDYFRHVPKLEILDLSRNQIGFLPDKVFAGLGNLKKLYIWNNNLTGLTKNMFAGLNKLQVLELSSNHLKQLAEDTFSSLQNLVNISLRNNDIEQAHRNLFINNSLLENIRLNWNRKLVLSDFVFSNLSLLHTVELSYNNMNEIPENVFKGSSKLQYVTLKGNRLTIISEKTFSGLNRLQKLDMSNNMLSILPNNTFSSLKGLKDLDLSNNQLKNISGFLFRELFKLKRLDLSNNKISFIDLLAFRGLQDSLTYLDLSFNQWNGISNPIIDATPLNDCLQVEELILSYNQISQYPDVQALLKLKKLDLSHNLIQELLVNQFTHFNAFALNVNLTSNLIKHVNFYLAERFAKLNTENYDAVHYNDGHSTNITLDYNPVLCDCSNYDLIRYNNDEMEVINTLVELRQDKLTCSNDNKILVKNLKPYHIDCPVLKGCPSPCSCSYKPYQTAVVVDCSFNNLTEYPEFYFNVTSHQQTILNLSGNYLEEGPVEGLNYDNVTYLDLSLNQITEISWIPPHIKELNLNENNLKKLNRDVIKMFKNRSSLEQLHLNGNSWECDCGALYLQKYIMEFYRKVNSSDVYCSKSHAYLVNITDLCKVSPYLTVFLPIALSVLLCFAVAFALYYRYQTEIKIYLYAKHLCLWFVTEEELDRDKTFDVFISYAHQDEKFIVEHLLPELEHGETPFKVCVHARDWIPGEFISKQVVTSVKDSRRTLVVLSNHFVDSVWGKLEFRTAHTEAVSEGRARVIVVIFGDLDEDRLDDELKSYLKTNTYVKWGDKYFWNKLKYALPHSKNNFYERNTKHGKMMLKIDDKFDLIKNPPSPANTSTPPITLEPSLLEKSQIRIDISNKVEGEDPLMTRMS